MTLSLINSKLSRDLPAWSVDTFVLEPFRECKKHFLQTFASSTPKNGTTLSHRVLHLVAAVSLLIPLVNTIVYIALRYFVKPSFPEKSIAGSFDAAVKKAQVAAATVQNEAIKVAFKEYVEFIEKSVRKLIGAQTADDIMQLIYESVVDELESIASQIREISFDSWANIQESPEAIAWQKAIRDALQSSDDEGVKRLIERGQKEQFLNQSFYTWFGGTFFIHIAKRDRNIRYLPLLKECQADPNWRDMVGNTGLIWACANASNGSARKILEVFGEGSYLDAQCLQQNTALHLIVGKGYKDKSCDGATLACSNLDLLKMAIALKADVNLPDRNGNRPLHLAYLRRDCEMVQTLLDAGANREMTNLAGQKPKDLLNTNYQQACEILKGSITIFLLDQIEFQKNTLILTKN